MLANFVFLSLAEVMLVPVFAVLYNVSLAGIVGRLAIVLVLGTLGLVITGTVFSAISAHARMRELLLPLLLLPILAPHADRRRGSHRRAVRRSAGARPHLGRFSRWI